MGGQVSKVLFPAPTPRYNRARGVRLAAQDSNLHWLHVPLVVDQEKKKSKSQDEKKKDLYVPCLYFVHPDSNGLAIYFHGNGEDIFGVLRSGVVSQYRYALGLSLIVVEYSGYGAHPRKEANEASINQDCLSVCMRVLREYLPNGGPDARVVLIGRSLGSGPAIYCARKMREAHQQGVVQRSIDAVLLISAYRSMKIVMSEHGGLGWVGSKLLGRGPWVSEKSIVEAAGTDVPFALVHGKSDGLIRATHSEALFGLLQRSERKRASRHLLELVAGGHNDMSQFGICQVLRKFLNGAVEGLQRGSREAGALAALRFPPGVCQTDGSVVSSSSASSSSVASRFVRAVSGSLSASVAASSASLECVSATVSKSTPLPQVIRKGFFPMNEDSMSQRLVDPRQRRKLCDGINGQEVKLRTRDGEELDAVFSTPQRESKQRTCAVVFHGNGMILDSMGFLADLYHNHGMYCLLVTVRGYPGSTGDSVKAGELGVLADVEAAAAFLLVEQQFQASCIVAHGYSLGGSLAASAALYYGFHLTLDHTFTSSKAVVQGIATRVTSGWVPKWLSGALARTAYSSGARLSSLADPLEGAPQPLTEPTTDGLDSLRKVRAMGVNANQQVTESTSSDPTSATGNLFVIFGSKDELMPVGFAKSFLEARYGAPPADSEGKLGEALNHSAALHVHDVHACCIEDGDHCSPKLTDDDALVAHYTSFLVRNGLCSAKE